MERPGTGLPHRGSDVHVARSMPVLCSCGVAVGLCAAGATPHRASRSERVDCLLAGVGRRIGVSYGVFPLVRGSNSYASKEEARMLNYDLTPAD